MEQKTKSNAPYQESYRNRLKNKLGLEEYKKQQAQKMREYRKSKKSTSIDQTKITNKETRTLVNNLLKNIEQRIIDMVKEKKIKPIDLQFESPILKDQIQSMLVVINDSMTNDQVLDAFEENEINNPRNQNFTATRDTFKRYLDRVQFIRRLYYNIDNPKIKVYNDFDFLRDSDKILKIIKDNSPNSNTYSTTINAISATLGRLKNYQDIYKQVYMPLNTTIAIQKKEEQKNKENNLNDDEKQNYLPWNKIIKLETQVKQTQNNTNENIAIFYLYTQIPPRRVADYEALKIAIDNKDFVPKKSENYVLLNQKINKVEKIILNKYKTSKKYKQFVVEQVPTKLSDSIINLITEKNYQPNDFLFQNEKGKRYGQGFSSRIKRVFVDSANKGITANILRHSYISHALKGKVSLLKKEQIANAMGHSVAMQAEYERFNIDEGLN